ncbi:MAG: GPI anchored serine-threonine rich family protein, partial [Candidatus Aminicenantes bacterium]|nr:GPI anchored serine-threonine rich family protein [Candidatus Aminicenantes bacterium]
MNRKSARAAGFLVAFGFLCLGTAFPAVNDILVHLSGKDACLASDPSSTAYYLACTDTAVANNAVVIFKSTDQGATWQTWATLQRTGVKIGQPRIKVSGAKLYFVFAADPSSANKLYFGTISLSNPATRREFELGDRCTAPDLAVYGDKAYIVWGGYEDLSPFPYDIYFTKFDFTTEAYVIPALPIGGQNIVDQGVYIRPSIDLDIEHDPKGTKLIVAFEDNYAHEIHVTTSGDGGTSFATHHNITNTPSVNESNPKVKFHFYVDSDYTVVAFNTGGANNSLDYLASVDLFTTVTPFDTKANFPTLSGGGFDFRYVSESYSYPNRSVKFRGAHWENNKVRLFELELRQHMGIYPPELDTYITPGVTFATTSDVDPAERVSYDEPPDANRCVAWTDNRNSGGHDVYFNGTTTVQKTITVTAPASGTIWTRGQSATVTWTTTGTIASVNIKLYKGTTKVQDIVLGTTNDGTHTFTVASGLVNGPDYRVLVEDAANAAIYDYSDYFVVEAKNVTVTLPTSATVWTKGSSGTVNWATTGTITAVNIHLYKSTSKVKDIALNTPNDHTQTWPVPTDLADGTDYRVRVTDAVLTGVYDDSDTFTVQSVVVETVSTPTTPSGVATVAAWTSSTYATGGSVSNLGHSVQYLIEWGEGSD